MTFLMFSFFFFLTKKQKKKQQSFHLDYIHRSCVYIVPFAHILNNYGLFLSEKKTMKHWSWPTSTLSHVTKVECLVHFHWEKTNLWQRTCEKRKRKAKVEYPHYWFFSWVFFSLQKTLHVKALGKIFARMFFYNFFYFFLLQSLFVTNFQEFFFRFCFNTNFIWHIYFRTLPFWGTNSNINVSFSSSKW
jgi:hypothetical protein